MIALRRHFHAAAGGLPGPFWTLWWGLLINRIATFVGAFLATFLVRERGLSVAGAGRVVALFGLGLTLAGPLGGALADRVGRRATMVFGLAAGALAVAALALALSLPALAACAFCAGAFGELYRPAQAAAVADLVPPSDRPRAFGLVYWAVNLGLALGLLLASLFAASGLVPLFFADAGTSALCAILVFARVPETRPPGLAHDPALRGMARALSDGPFVVFLLLHLAALVVFCQWQLGLPLDMAAHGLGPSAFAVLLGLNCAGVVVLQPLTAALVRRSDGVRLLAAMALLFGLGYGLNALGGSLWVYGTGAALWTVGEVLGFPVASTLVADLAPPELRGRYQGAFSMVFGLAFTLSPLLGGEVLERWGGRTLWLGCLAVAVLVAVGHLAAAGPRRRRLAEVLGQGRAS